MPIQKVNISDDHKEAANPIMYLSHVIQMGHTRL